MNILKKILAPSGQQQELEAYETWIVRWESRYGECSFETQPEMEVFTSKEDAEKFAVELRNAFKLIRHTSGTDVNLRKNRR
jgi:hypothetical protein